MPDYDYRLKYAIYDYSIADLTEVPLKGEKRYFETILTGITHPCYVFGDGTSQVNALPFVGLINISTSTDINLEILKITGNRVSVANTHTSSININIGSAASPDQYSLSAGGVIEFRYFSSKWNEIITGRNDSLGLKYNIDHEDRASAYVVTGGSASTFTEIDLSPYIDNGSKGVTLWVESSLSGNAVADYSRVYIRTYGSTVVMRQRVITEDVGRSNLPSSVSIFASGEFTVACSTDLKVQYAVEDAGTGRGSANITPVGYYK